MLSLLYWPLPWGGGGFLDWYITWSCEDFRCKLVHLEIFEYCLLAFLQDSISEFLLEGLNVKVLRFLFGNCVYINVCHAFHACKFHMEFSLVRISIEISCSTIWRSVSRSYSPKTTVQYSNSGEFNSPLYSPLFEYWTVVLD